MAYLYGHITLVYSCFTAHFRAQMGWYQPAKNVVRPILEPMCLVEAFLGMFDDFKRLNMLQRHYHNTRDHRYCAEKHIRAPMHEFSLNNSTPVRPRRW